MGDKTGIEWTDATWNPVRGCSRVSPGCQNCYAERVAARFSGPGQPYEGLAEMTSSGPRWTRVVRVVGNHLADPLRWRKPRRIFVNSMSDLFHESLTNEQIAAVFGVMAAAPQHTFQVLTKRAKRMREWFTWMQEQIEVDGDPWTTMMRETTCWLPEDRAWAKYLDEHDHIEDACFEPWPLPNVWLGVSVENQDAANERIPELRATPAAVRFLSCEPLLGPVNPCATPDDRTRPAEFSARYTPLGDLDWVIVGCESGPGARPAQVEWYRKLRDLCADARVAFFLKQAMHDDPTGGCGIHDLSDDDRKRLISLPHLDGRQHAAFPEARP